LAYSRRSNRQLVAENSLLRASLTPQPPPLIGDSPSPNLYSKRNYLVIKKVHLPVRSTRAPGALLPQTAGRYFSTKSATYRCICK